jgi:hypothetical protein
LLNGSPPFLLGKRLLPGASGLGYIIIFLRFQRQVLDLQAIVVFAPFATIKDRFGEEPLGRLTSRAWVTAGGSGTVSVEIPK